MTRMLGIALLVLALVPPAPAAVQRVAPSGVHVLSTAIGELAFMAFVGTGGVVGTLIGVTIGAVTGD